MITYLGGLLLGWGLGANDSANVFGTAVSSNMVKFRTAVILIAVFVIIGACLQGAEGIETLRKLSAQTKQSSALTVLAAALTVVLMTGLKLPVSTSQAVVGSIVGLGLMRNQANLAGLKKVIVCWLGTPIGGMLFCVLFYSMARYLINKYRPNMFKLDPVLRIGLVICGCYGAYALGANNVANVSAVFVGREMFTARTATLLGAVAIAIGSLTYSKNVMMTVGKGIVKLDSVSALICVLSQAVTVHIFAIVGVPVSTSQAIIGAVIGISLIKGIQVINIKTLGRVCCGWLLTPVVAASLAVLMHLFVCFTPTRVQALCLYFAI